MIMIGRKNIILHRSAHDLLVLFVDGAVRAVVVGVVVGVAVLVDFGGFTRWLLLQGNRRLPLQPAPSAWQPLSG